MATGSLVFGNPVQMYSKKSSHSKSDCIMELGGTIVPQKELFLDFCAELRGTANGTFGSCVCHTEVHQNRQR